MFSHAVAPKATSMPVESAPYVGALVGTYPSNSDPVQQGSDHLRLVKTALVASFPNISGPMTAGHEELSAVPGKVSSLEANRARKDVGDVFEGAMSFSQGLNAVKVQRGSAELEPVGTIHAFIGPTPTGYLLLAGGTGSRTAHAKLFALWGTTFGVGDGSTTFGLPNLQSRYLRGTPAGGTAGVLGGSATPSVTVASGGAHAHGITAYAAGGHAHGGATAATVLSEAQMPYHTHSGVALEAGWHEHSYVSQRGGGGTPTTTAGGIGPLTDTTGGSGNHQHSLSINPTGGNEAHLHGIYTDGEHGHSGVTDNHPGHTHTATVAEHFQHITVNFIVRAF